MSGAPSGMPLHVLETAPLGTSHIPLQWDGWMKVPQYHHPREGNPVLRACICPQPALHNNVMPIRVSPTYQRDLCSPIPRTPHFSNNETA